jgi:hypothetical protein
MMGMNYLKTYQDKWAKPGNLTKRKSGNTEEKSTFFSFYRITSFLQMAAVAATADKLQLAQAMSVLNANGRIHQITTSHFLPHPC